MFLLKKNRPFHCLRRFIHKRSSLRHELVRDKRSSSAWTEDTRGRRCEMSGDDAHREIKVAESSSRLEERVWLMRVEATKIVLSIFSPGRDAWNFPESKLIPKNSMDVLGPMVFLLGPWFFSQAW